jgi:hypothetical protein
MRGVAELKALDRNEHKRSLARVDAVIGSLMTDQVARDLMEEPWRVLE